MALVQILNIELHIIHRVFQGNTACKQSLLRSRYGRFTADIKLKHVYKEIKCESNIKKISSLTKINNKILTNIRSIRVLKIIELSEC